jgi:hypothetical protein
MKTQKMSLGNIKDVLSRDEMREIMAGSIGGYYCRSCCNGSVLCTYWVSSCCGLASNGNIYCC